jgi:hypothetical protein
MNNGGRSPFASFVGIDWKDFARSPLVLAAFAVFVGAHVLLYVFYRDSERDALKAAEENVSTLAFSLAQHVEGTFSSADQLLKISRRAYLDDPRSLADIYERHNASVDRKSFPLEGLIRADGFVYLSSSSPRDFEGAAKVNLSDRPHYRAHLDSREDRPFVSPPITGRMSGKPVLNMSRRIDGPDGKLSGVAVVSVSPDNFIAPYRQIVDSTGVVSLFGRDGIARVRITKSATEAAVDVSASPNFDRLLATPAGSYRATSTVDGVPRLYAYRALKDYPLIVVVGYGLEELRQRHDNGVIQRLPIRLAFSVLGLGGLLILAIWSRVLQQRLRASNASKSRLVAAVSHELRTPLHGITGHAQMLMLDIPAENAEARESADAIFQSARHLRRIVDDLLDIAKAESGAQALDFQPSDIGRLVRQVAGLHGGAAQAKGLRLDTDFSDSLPPDFVTDATALERVLHNLMSNAIKFTASGSVCLAAKLVQDGGLRFEVRDTGTGIPAEKLPHLFDAYGHATVSTDGAVKGTGLGLALSVGLVKALGGSLAVTSEPGQGTTFSFALRR